MRRHGQVAHLFSQIIQARIAFFFLPALGLSSHHLWSLRFPTLCVFSLFTIVAISVLQPKKNLKYFLFTRCHHHQHRHQQKRRRRRYHQQHRYFRVLIVNLYCM